jgi:hypothetical protein
MYEHITRWFKYDRDWLCVNKSQFVPVVFEPPCTFCKRAGDTKWEQHRISRTLVSLNTIEICMDLCQAAFRSGEVRNRSEEKMGDKKHVQKATCYAKINSDFHRYLKMDEASTLRLTYSISHWVRFSRRYRSFLRRLNSLCVGVFNKILPLQTLAWWLLLGMWLYTGGMRLSSTAVKVNRSKLRRRTKKLKVCFLLFSNAAYVIPVFASCTFCVLSVTFSIDFFRLYNCPICLMNTKHNITIIIKLLKL